MCMALCTVSCKTKMKINNHSYSNYQELTVNHISLDLNVNFEKKSLSGHVVLNINNHGKSRHIVLDHKNMVIEKVWVDNSETAFKTGESDEILGAALEIPIQQNSKSVKIQYHTLEDAEALQWLSPEQTNDKKHPFLFSQSQAILARTWIPLMDAPAVRFTYDAKIQVPPHLMALMSAINPIERNAEGVYTFKQEKPIPSYLMAIAAGDFYFKPLGRNTGVYAEPGMLDKSVWEFADMQEMVDSAESLYGPYAWGRYDVLVLPPSFPFGGMENPVLTFATPTIIAGDRSLVSLIAHELAHSWSGNLVTNETWSDFWLNEGFTVYFEQRIMEKIYGAEYAEMLTALARGELQRTVDSMMSHPDEVNDTKLYLNLDGRNPDDGVTDIAYEKGRFFLRSIEKLVGRQEWDAFLVNYFKTHAFGTMNTQRFIEYVNTTLLNKKPEWKNAIDMNEWIFNTGLPSQCEQIQSVALSRVDSALSKYAVSKNPEDLKAGDYTTHHWMYMLRNIKAADTGALEAIDKQFGFSNSGNAEILCDWFQLCVRNQYTAPYPQMRKFLKSVGRRKFLTPIYRELVATAEGKALAKDIFAEAKSGYHAVAVKTIADMLGE